VAVNRWPRRVTAGAVVTRLAGRRGAAPCAAVFVDIVVGVEKLAGHRDSRIIVCLIDDVTITGAGIVIILGAGLVEQVVDELFGAVGVAGVAGRDVGGSDDLRVGVDADVALVAVE